MSNPHLETITLDLTPDDLGKITGCIFIVKRDMKKDIEKLESDPDRLDVEALTLIAQCRADLRLLETLYAKLKRF